MYNRKYGVFGRDKRQQDDNGDENEALAGVQNHESGLPVGLAARGGSRCRRGVGEALHLWSESSAVEPGEGQMGNVGSGVTRCLPSLQD